MRVLRASDQKRLNLSPYFKQGGEGTLHRVAGHADLVAKLYKDALHPQGNATYHKDALLRASKIALMVKSPPDDPMKSQNHHSIAWPIDLLLSDRNPRTFVGFLMPRLSDIYDITVLYNPKARRRQFPGANDYFLYNAAYNLATSMHAVHRAGYVIGDVNDGNIQVLGSSFVSLVDTDSFQVSDPATGLIHRCPVGMLEYTAPEVQQQLQGRGFGDIDRTIEHDAFGLAVILFKLLMGGLHPFDGNYIGPIDPPPPAEERVRHGNFPYWGDVAGVNVARTQPPFWVLDQEVRALFRRCFVDGHGAPASRPTAQEWANTLKSARDGLRACSAGQSHFFAAHLNECPRCNPPSHSGSLSCVFCGVPSSSGAAGLGGRSTCQTCGNRMLVPQPTPAAATVASASFPSGSQFQLPASGSGAMPTQLPTHAAAPTTAGAGQHLQPAPFQDPSARLLGLIVILSFLVLAWNRQEARAPINPPRQIVDQGAIRGEGWAYGGRWLAKREVEVFVNPPTALGAPLSSLTKAATIRPGTWVRTQTGLALSSRLEGRVKVTANQSPYGGSVENGPPLKDGQVIPVYTELGEGCWTAWINGQLLVVCNVEVQGRAVNEWWIQLKLSDGSSAWFKDSEGVFVTEEQLNSSLGDVIADVKLSLPRRLAKIDLLQKEGADLNGDAGAYGTNPAWAAICTNDIELMSALTARGLSLSRGDPCLARTAAQGKLFDAGGEKMLEFLLSNGMSLGCLKEPALKEYLISAVHSEQSSVDDVVRISRILMRHGAKVDQRDSSGKTILDYLAELKNKSRAERLISELKQISSGAASTKDSPSGSPVPSVAPSLTPPGLPDRAGPLVKQPTGSDVVESVRLRIVTNPPGASVVGVPSGTVYGETPISVTVKAEPWKFLLQKAGYKSTKILGSRSGQPVLNSSASSSKVDESDGKPTNTYEVLADLQADASAQPDLNTSEEPEFLAEPLLPDGSQATHTSAYEAQFDRGRSYAQSKQYQRAEQELLACVRANPDDARPYKVLSIVYLNTGQPSRAEQYIRKATSLDPSDWNGFVLLGTLYSKQGAWAKAELAYRGVLARRPGYCNGRVLIADMALKQGKLNAAAEEVELARKCAGGDARLATIVASLTETIALQRSGVASTSGSKKRELSKAKLEVGEEYHRQGKLAVAEAATREALLIDASNDTGYYQLGLILREGGNLAGAEQAFRTAVRLSPRLAASNTALALVLVERKKFVEAEDFARTATVLKPDTFNGWSALGFALKGQGRLDEAIQSMSRASSLNPSNTEVRNSVAEWRALLQRR